MSKIKRLIEDITINLEHIGPKEELFINKKYEEVVVPLAEFYNVPYTLTINLPEKAVAAVVKTKYFSLEGDESI